MKIDHVLDKQLTDMVNTAEAMLAHSKELQRYHQQALDQGHLETPRNNVVGDNASERSLARVADVLSTESKEHGGAEWLQKPHGQRESSTEKSQRARVFMASMHAEEDAKRLADTLAAERQVQYHRLEKEKKAKQMNFVRQKAKEATAKAEAKARAVEAASDSSDDSSSSDSDSDSETGETLRGTRTASSATAATETMDRFVELGRKAARELHAEGLDEEIIAEVARDTAYGKALEAGGTGGDAKRAAQAANRTIEEYVKAAAKRDASAVVL